MSKFIGGLLVISSVVLGIWLGVFVMFVGGIVQFIQACQTNPINAYEIGLGILKVISSGFVGWLSFGILFSFGAALLDN